MILEKEKVVSLKIAFDIYSRRKRLLDLLFYDFKESNFNEQLKFSNQEGRWIGLKLLDSWGPSEIMGMPD